MDGPRWQQVKAMLDQATGLSGPELAQHLDRACGGDAELRAELSSLLAHDRPAGTALDRPVFDLHARDPRLGRRLGPYRLVRQLGRGGMGTVYLARREDDFSKEVAIKLIQRGFDTPGRIARFHEERQILADLEHPLIARLLDGGTTEQGLPYLVMERIEGQPIDRYCESRRLDVDQRLRLFCQVLEAVEFSHRHLVVHRDLKPGNILVTPGGEPRLIDFGIAKLLRSSGGEAAASIRPRHRRMSPLYASPEQLRGEALTPASDVFALGVVLYVLLCGRYPRGRPESEAELEKLLSAGAPAAPSVALLQAGEGSAGAPAGEIAQSRRTSVAGLRRRLRGDLDAIVLVAMSPNPGDRYPSAGGLREDLERYLALRPVRARPATRLSAAGKLVRRHRLAFTALALALVAAASLLAAAAYRAHAERQRSQAAAVEEFVGQLFRAAGPDRADGRDLTVRELLDQGFDRLGGGLEDEPLVRSALLSVVGRVYLDLGELERAEALHREALELQRRHDPGDSLAVARRANDLAVVLRERGEIDGAERLYREALERYGGCRSPHADAVWVAGNLAWLRTTRGDWREAESLLDCCLERCRGPAKLDVPTCSSLLAKQGALHHRRGRLEAAARVFRQVAAMRESYFGRHHTETATAYHNLGRVLLDSGDYPRAEIFFQRALSIRRQLLGAEHRKTVNTAEALRETREEEAPPEPGPGSGGGELTARDRR